MGLLSSQFHLRLPIAKKWAIIGSGRVSYLNLFLEPLVRQFSTEESDLGYNFRDLNLTLVGQLSKRNRLKIDLLVGSDKLNITDQESFINGYLKWKNLVSSIKLTTQLSNKLVMHQMLYGSLFKNQLHTAQGEMALNLKSDILNWGYKGHIEQTVKWGSLIYGMDYEHPNTDPHQLYFYNATPISKKIKEKSQSAHQFSLFIQTKIRPTDKLEIKTGLRQNFFLSKIASSRKNFRSIDVRTQLRYLLTNTTYLRASYSHNNQYILKLSPSSIGLPTDFWVISNNKIKPQLSNNYTIGLFHSLLNGAYELTIDGYYNRMQGLTEFDYNFTEAENGSYIDRVTYGKGDAYGVELLIKKNRGKLRGWLSYAWGKSDRRFRTIDQGRTFPSRFDRRHDLSLLLMYEFNSKWSLSFQQIFATGNTYTQPTSWYVVNEAPVKEYTKHNNARLPNYIRSDINFKYNLSKRQSITLACYNLLGRKNPIYVFAKLRGYETEDGTVVKLKMRNKRLYTFIPSISWNIEI